MPEFTKINKKRNVREEISKKVLGKEVAKQVIKYDTNGDIEKSEIFMQTDTPYFVKIYDYNDYFIGKKEVILRSDIVYPEGTLECIKSADTKFEVKNESEFRLYLKRHTIINGKDAGRMDYDHSSMDTFLPMAKPAHKTIVTAQDANVIKDTAVGFTPKITVKELTEIADYLPTYSKFKEGEDANIFWVNTPYGIYKVIPNVYLEIVTMLDKDFNETLVKEKRMSYTDYGRTKLAYDETVHFNHRKYKAVYDVSYVQWFDGSSDPQKELRFKLRMKNTSGKRTNVYSIEGGFTSMCIIKRNITNYNELGNDITLFLHSEYNNTKQYKNEWGDKIDNATFNTSRWFDLTTDLKYKDISDSYLINTPKLCLAIMDSIIGNDRLENGENRNIDFKLADGKPHSYSARMTISDEHVYSLLETEKEDDENNRMHHLRKWYSAGAFDRVVDDSTEYTSKRYNEHGWELSSIDDEFMIDRIYTNLK